MKFKLTELEEQTLLYQHDHTRDGRVRDRIKSIIHTSNGWSAEEIADALLIHESTVRRNLRDFQESKKLTPENGGSKSKLTDKQTKELIKHLKEVTYTHVYQICSYIQNTYDVTYSVSGLNKWLHSHGFSYKQPKGVPHKFSEEKQAEFIEEYETIKSSLQEDDVLMFMDAVHPTQATKITYGWLPTGTDKAVETTGSRTRLNIISAIRLGHLPDTITSRYDTINSDSIIDFLEQIRRALPDKKIIHLVLDGAGYHRTKSVQEKALELGIILHYLPPYSPNLNPVERLWKVMNEKVRNNRYFASAKEFQQTIDEFFTIILPNIGHTLNSRINDNFQVLTRASPG